MIDWISGRPQVFAVLAVLSVLLGAAIGFGSTLLGPPRFTASADTRLIVHGEPGYPEEAMRSALRQAAILADLAVGGPQLERTAERLDPPITAGELVEIVSARRHPDLLVITLSARHPDPQRAADIANALARSLLEATNQQEASPIRLEMVGEARPPVRPSHPYLPRNLAIGIIVGLVVAAVAALRLSSASRPSPDRPIARGIIDGWRIAVGAGLGLALWAAMAAQVPSLAIQGIAAVSLVVAALSPTAGLATLAVMIPMREPPGFVPVGYVPLLVGATAYGATLAALATRSLRRPPVLAVMAVGYLAISAVATIPFLGGLEGDQAVNAIARLIQVTGGVVLVMVAWWHFSRHDARPHLALAVVSAAFAAVLGIIQYLDPDLGSVPLAGLIFVEPGVVDVTRATGPFFNPNYYGFFLAVTLVLPLGVSTIGGWWRLAALAAVPIAVALVLTFSRGALLAAGAGVVALLWTRNRAVGIAVAVGGAALLLFLIPTLLDVRAGPSYVPAPPNLGDEISDRGRFDAMLSAFPVWLNDPLFGVGFGQYGFESSWFVGSSPSTSSHNEYLSILAEQGLVGGLLFGAMALGVLARVLGTDGWRRRLVLPSVVAFAAGWLIIEPLASLQTSGLLWLTLASAAGPARAVAHAAKPLTSSMASASLPGGPRALGAVTE